jgi:hypothetical protein
MTDMGALECIVRTGATVSFRGTPKKIKALGVFQVAPHVAGQSRSFDASTGNLVYQAYFTDGSWGIYEVFFP